MSFEKFGINTAILDALKKEGFEKPTPIQARAVPALLAGSDLLGGAETGTGKTAAFTIPVLDKLSCRKRDGKHPRALILVPTRELAQQVYENVKSYGRFLRLTSAEIYGGVNIQPQIKKLDLGCDIVIATPGRLLDLINQDAVKLKNIEMLVLDEADRMLDMGFINDIKKILGFIPKERQTMMFSATFPPEIKKLADRMLDNPEIIELSPKNKAAVTVAQSAYPVINDKKLKLLYRLVKDRGWYQVLVFTKTKRRAQSLSRQLVKKGVSADAIHGDKSQNARTRALKDFKTGKIQALVATDIAARGIDINQLDCVINFQLPQAPEDYIHRIGRTGRAGQAGTAVTLVSDEDIEQFRAIEKHLGRKIDTILMEDFITDNLRMEIEASELKDKVSASSKGRKGRGYSKVRTSGHAEKRTSAAGFSRRGEGRDSGSVRRSGRQASDSSGLHQHARIRGEERGGKRQGSDVPGYTGRPDSASGRKDGKASPAINSDNKSRNSSEHGIRSYRGRNRSASNRTGRRAKTA